MVSPDAVDEPSAEAMRGSKLKRSEPVFVFVVVDLKSRARTGSSGPPTLP